METDDKPRDLDIEDDEQFARREALAERVGWVLVALALLAALLGLFANGPLSHRSVESDNVLVRYQRFGRNQGNTSLEVEARATAATDGKVEVWVSQTFLESYDLEDVSPEPESTTTRSGGLVFAFPVEGTDTPVRVTFSLRPEHSGRHHGAVAVADGRPATFSQFVYP